MKGVYERRDMKIVCVNREKTMMKRKNGTSGKGFEDVATTCLEETKMNEKGAEKERDEV